MYFAFCSIPAVTVYLLESVELEEMFMRLSMLFLAVVALFFAPMNASAHPYSIMCPVDGNTMMFDHQVGYGAQAVCWYSHMGWDSGSGRSVKHQAYVACND